MSAQVADIAVSSAKTAKNIAGIEPRVAMLSFSTKGSGGDNKFFKSVCDKYKRLFVKHG